MEGCTSDHRGGRGNGRGRRGGRGRGRQREEGGGYYYQHRQDRDPNQQGQFLPRNQQHYRHQSQQPGGQQQWRVPARQDRDQNQYGGQFLPTNQPQYSQQWHPPGDQQQWRVPDQGGTRSSSDRGALGSSGRSEYNESSRSRSGWNGGEGRGRELPQGKSHASASQPYPGGNDGYRRSTTTRGPPQGASRASASQPFPVSVTQKMQILKISEQLPSSPLKSSERLHPVKRPDKGGESSIQSVRLLVNHFPVNFNPQTIILHYDVDIKPEVPPRHGRPVRIPKYQLSMIRHKLFSSNPSQFPLSKTAYDGEKNILSVVPLPVGKFKIEFSEGEDTRIRSYIFTITLVSELKLCKLKDYLCGKLHMIPREILQGMDIVMKENPARHMISVGRGFYPSEFSPQDYLGHGISASRGFQHSLKPTSQGLAMCLDYSVLAFRKRLPVIEFLEEHLDNFNVNNFRMFRKEVENALRGLKVTVTHRITKQKYVIVGLTEQNARDIFFTVVDPDGAVPPREESLVNYFREKYRRDIACKDIPCLNLGKGSKQNYVPMEFCVLVEGQRCSSKEDLDKDAARLLRDFSLAKPLQRMGKIRAMVQDHRGPSGGEVARNFGVELDTNMTSVTGRIIAPPDLKLGARNGDGSQLAVERMKCQWNLVGKLVVEGKSIQRWAVIDFSSFERSDRLNPDKFIPKLINRCKTLGIHMEEPLLYENAGMKIFHDLPRLHELLETVTARATRSGKSKLQIVLCVMSRRDEGYKHLKWICDTKIGVATQCCLSNGANRSNDQYIANLALKLNAKLGGSNVELVDRLPRFEGESHVMFVGADVNHPAARNTTSPSITAVVATMNWPAVSQYAARVRPQEHRKETILNFGEMCLELVQAYSQRNNKIRPEKIVIFRDGVSESQFDMVLNDELVGLKKAFERENYSPTVSLIVAQKRHQTRLFPQTARDGSPNGNVLPGTVVDRTIVHPFEFDFYLCSHFGSIGTSKPTHYHVLWDEHGFTSDQLQQLIYNLCFTFARCTKPVSLVPPVYYADLAAYRGRLYYEALAEGWSSAYASSSSSSSSSLTSTSLSWPSSLDEYRLHGDIENAMFFV